MYEWKHSVAFFMLRFGYNLLQAKRRKQNLVIILVVRLQLRVVNYKMVRKELRES